MNTAGRLTGCLLVLTAVLMPERGTAQDSPYGGGPYYGGPNYGGGSPNAWGGAPGGMYGPPPPQACPPEYAGMMGGGPVGPGGGGAGYYNAQGAADYWEGPSPLETTLAHYLQNGVFRLEYLSWSIQEPGRTALGAPLGLPQNPLTGFPDPRLPFPVFDNSLPPIQIGDAVVPNLSDVDLNRVDGVRGTMVLPFYRGDFEFSAFALREANDVVDVPGLRRQIEDFTFGLLTIIPGSFAATSLLENGVPSDRLLLYNDRFGAAYSSNLWGAEGVFVGDAWPFSLPVRSEFINVRPLAGFRFLDFDEQLTQVGIFENPIDVVPPLVSTIDSVSNNEMYGVVLGTRVELVDKWFTLGVEPRWTLGWGYYENIVTTDNLLAEDDPVTRATDSATIFSPAFDVKTYAKVHVHKNFSVWFGYDYMQLFRVTRPDKNIVYDSINGEPRIGVDTEIDSIAIQGVSLGGEIIFR